MMNLVWWLCSTAERRLYTAAADNKNVTTLNNSVNYNGDVELMSLRGCDADCEQHEQLKPHQNHHHHHHATDCCSYSHVWPLMTATDNRAARQLSTSTPRRYLGFDVQSERHCENVEHTYRSVYNAAQTQMLFLVIASSTRYIFPFSSNIFIFYCYSSIRYALLLCDTGFFRIA